MRLWFTSSGGAEIVTKFSLARARASFAHASANDESSDTACS
jgi:hypothetical protein